MNGDFVFLVVATLIPPLWLAIGIVGRVSRARGNVLRERRRIS